MKLEVWESCYNKGYIVNDVHNEKLSRNKKIQIIKKMLVNATNEQLDYLIQDYAEQIGNSIKFESDTCDQCGNWNYTNTLEI